MLLVAIGCKNQESVNQIEGESVASQSVSTVELNNLDDLVKYSQEIVYGTVIDVEPFSDTTHEYLIQVHETYKTKLDAEDIYVYEVEGTLNRGDSYVLFLNEFTGGFFPHPAYTSIHKESILKVDDQDLVHSSPQIPQNMVLDEIIQEISNSDGLAQQVQTENDLVLLNNANLQELTDHADIIAEVTPTKFTTENKYMKIAEVKVINSHKGHLESGSIVHFPASIELEKEYLVYLRDVDGALFVNSVDKGIIDTGEHQALDEALQILEN